MMTYLEDCTGTTGAGEVIAPGVEPRALCNLICEAVISTDISIQRRNVSLTHTQTTTE